MIVDSATRVEVTITRHAQCVVYYNGIFMGMFCKSFGYWYVPMGHGREAFVTKRFQDALEAYLMINREPYFHAPWTEYWMYM